MEGSSRLQFFHSPSSLDFAVHPNYLKVFLTFSRNSLVRDMSFRMNFLLQCFATMAWAAMNFGLFKIIYQFTGSIGRDSGWHENEFFIFLGTIWIINCIIQTFFMANAEEFSEMIRTGGLDFALLKPIDTQFLISFPRVNWAQIPNGILGVILIIVSLRNLANDGTRVEPLTISLWNIFPFVFYVMCGAAVMYSVMIVLASTSVWLGRNQNLYTFWFYITNFYRYPMEIYQRNGIGMALWGTFTFIVPILVVSNVPARVLAQPLGRSWMNWEAGYAIFAAAVSLYVSRQIFHWALRSYRSASS